MDDRRDPRPEGEPASKRVEVIESRNAATSAVLDLKRELIRLTERAQVVESSLTVERRQRGEALAEMETHKEREAAAQERAKAAEERAKAAEERTKIAEVRAKTSEGRSRTAEDRAKMTEDRANAAIERAKKAEERAKASEDQAKVAEDEAKAAEERAITAEEHAKVSHERAKAAEDRAKTAEERAKATEERARATEERAKAAEERAKASEDRAKAAEDRARATDVLARAAEAFAMEAEDRAKAAEQQAEAEKERADASEAAEAAISRNLLELHDEVKTAFSRIPSFAPPPPSATETAVEQLGVDDGVDDIPGPAAVPRMSRSKPPSQAPAQVPSQAAPSQHPSDPPKKVVEPDPFPSIRPPPPAIYSSPPPPQRLPPPPSPRPKLRSNPPDATPAAPGVQSVARAVTPGPPPVVLDVPVAMGSVDPPLVTAPPMSRSTPELASLDDEWSKPMLLDMPLPVRQERDALLRELSDPERASAVVAALKGRDWLRGLPPESLVNDLAAIDYNDECAVFEIARAWERGAMSQSVVIHLQAETDGKRREHDAWLVQHLGAATDCQAICDIAVRGEEATATRIWLLKALARLAAAHTIDWQELLAPMTAIAFDADATIRDGATAVIDALPKGDEKRRLLLDILRKDDDENVLSRAIQAIGGTLPIEIGTALAERLLGHRSPRVQDAVRDLIALARARRSQMPPPRGSMPPGSSS